MSLSGHRVCRVVCVRQVVAHELENAAAEAAGLRQLLELSEKEVPLFSASFYAVYSSGPYCTPNFYTPGAS